MFTQRTTHQISNHQRTTEKHIEDRDVNMKTLKQHISEGLLQGMDDTLADGDIVSSELIRSQIDEFMQANYRDPKYRILKKPNKDGKFVVNCQGELRLRIIATELTNDLFVFGKVKNFTCFDNSNITSLKGAPEEVDNLNCAWCYNLRSLEGCPKVINKCALFNDSSVESLEGLPKIINGDLELKNTKLKNLIGAPEKVMGYFMLEGCMQLESLEGAPKYVGKTFDCSYCIELKSLEGGPDDTLHYNCDCCNALTSFKGVAKTIRGSFMGDSCYNLASLDMDKTTIARNFSIDWCKSLTSLNGSPKSVGDSYSATRCPGLTSLEGVTQNIGRELIVAFNPNLKSIEGCPKKLKMLDIHGGAMWDERDILAVCDCPNIAI